MSSRPAKRDNRPRVLGFQPAPALRAAISRWADRQADKPALPEAICRLIEFGLSASGDARKSSDGQKRRAREMAGSAIDNMSDATTTADDRASRKRNLLNGPEEFTRVRVDRPNRGKSAR